MTAVKPGFASGWCLEDCAGTTAGVCAVDANDFLLFLASFICVNNAGMVLKMISTSSRNVLFLT
jgi:hypothetical protein